VPTYDYQCRACGSVTEVIHSMLEEGPSVCERCGGELRRVLYPTGIIFKGSGFYRTDSREGGSPAATPSTAQSGDAKGGDSTGAGSKKGSETKAGSESPAKPGSGEGTKGSGASGT
jgi:putative FmdB family regulatory protein